ncbi:hypothetical protein F5Y13DRAFT_160883 [Hypoxylon sp. FL1857]|nr:hypothetical protein F5Y13DRAFT_160883 [Hypoxylon sp. FL1857]
MADVYRRSGRGGAGNFYSQKDIEEVTKKAAAEPKDLEAQNPHHLPDDEPPTDPADVPPQTASQIASATSSGAYARSGRGGAGNFVDPASILEGPTLPPSSTTTTAASRPQQPPPAAPRSGLSGRGGAGNWTSTEGEGKGEVYDPEQEHKRRAALDADILKGIRESLPQPPKIHYMHGPGRGRKPETLPTS